MKYYFPAQNTPFPWIEIYTFTASMFAIVSGLQKDFVHPWNTVYLGLGITLLCVTAILWLARVIWNDQPISEQARLTLYNEAFRFRLVRDTWILVCGEERHPTWSELDRIIFFVNHPVPEGLYE